MTAPAQKLLLKHDANRFALDYEELASGFARLKYPIIDVHAHINGKRAVEIYARAAALYGVGRTYSMTHLEKIDTVAGVLGDRIRFIAMLKFVDEERAVADNAHGLHMLREFHRKGARIVKFWSAPRGIDISRNAGKPGMLTLGAPHRYEMMKIAHDLGMVFMVHVSDPDTWFQSKYSDKAQYGSKRDHYRELRRLLKEFDNPWIAAHMGGWPEDLNFLDELLNDFPNLFIDSSATKWMVRELSKHSADDLAKFFKRWSGRVLFGSDIVTNEDHLNPSLPHETVQHIEARVFDLYASRYFALRTLFETSRRIESPIADPDLAMLDSAKYDAMSAPELCGKVLPAEVLEPLYNGAAKALLDALG